MHKQSVGFFMNQIIYCQKAVYYAIRIGGIFILWLIQNEFSLIVFPFYHSCAVLSDPAKRLDYDLTGTYEIDKYTLRV